MNTARAIELPTQARLRELLMYEPLTGVLRWTTNHATHRTKGRVAGGLNNGGYRMLRIDGRTRLAHRLIWMHYYGRPPEGCIDHRNGDRDDNRIENLRDVTGAENTQNQRGANKRSTSGYLGVFKDRKRWRAVIEVRGKAVSIGIYESPEIAHTAYVEAKRRLHPGCTL